MTIVSLPTKTATIGGSDAAAACGIDPHRSRVMLWLNKRAELGLPDPKMERPETEAMRWGTLLEPLVMDELIHAGWSLTTAEAVPDHPWLSGSPDGIAWRDDEPYLLEVKTVGQWAQRQWDGPPLEYVAQIQHYLHLTGLEHALLAVLVAGQRLDTYEIERDQDAIDRMLVLEERFYLDHLTPQTWDKPPAPDSSESAREALAAMFPTAVPGRVMRLDNAHWVIRTELLARREQRKAIEAQERGLENALKLAMGDAEIALSPGGEEAIRWPTVETTRLNVARVKEERPGVYELFAETTTTRRFTLL